MNTKYSVQVGTETRVGEYVGQIQSPTFILDSDIQGITDSAHAERIVRAWLRDAGLTVDHVSVGIYWE